VLGDFDLGGPFLHHKFCFVLGCGEMDGFIQEIVRALEFDVENRVFIGSVF
jgi:hypothetical protein